MYITLKSIKRNLGFNGIEVSDVIIIIPMLTFFIILFCFTNLKMQSLVGLMIGIFLLLPINVSKKNRMYKVIYLLLLYFLKKKYYVYKTERQK